MEPKIDISMIKIRKLKEGDIVKVVRLWRRAERITLKDYYPKKIIEWYCKNNTKRNIVNKLKTTKFWVAEDFKKNKIAGFIAKRDNVVKFFFVDPNYQRKGIGRMLFEKFIKQAVKNGDKYIFVKSSHYAIPIYKKFGFKIVKKIYRIIEGQKIYDTLMNYKIRH
ncbi:MAG: GNAT family N-acetyltransferase [Patescibacteria group bacterium]